MIRAGVLCLALALGGVAQAQEIIPGLENLFGDNPGGDNGDIMQQDWEQGILIPLDGGEATTEEVERVANGSRAVLRGLDKLTGDVRDLDVAVGETTTLGRMQVTLSECRYPETNPSGNAYAYLVISEPEAQSPEFSGWMIASAPALNALEHPRYDVWVMRCTT